jgi:hypothetical protein
MKFIYLMLLFLPLFTLSQYRDTHTFTKTNKGWIDSTTHYIKLWLKCSKCPNRSLEEDIRRIKPILGYRLEVVTKEYGTVEQKYTYYDYKNNVIPDKNIRHFEDIKDKSAQSSNKKKVSNQ